MARIIQVDGRKGNYTSNSGICIAPLRLKKDNNYKKVLGLPLWPLVLKKREHDDIQSDYSFRIAFMANGTGKKRTHDLKTNRDK